MHQPHAPRSLATTWFGRPFVHPLYDYLLVGGGLSLAFTVAVLASPDQMQFVDLAALPYFILLSNSAHFAASTVRLYTKPGARQALPFLTMAFPLVCLAVLTACMSLAGSVGPHVQALYLTWSPFHYAAQAYGLAVVYSYRSGCQLAPRDKKLLWWASMVPFFYACLASEAMGLRWFAPDGIMGWAPLAAGLEWAALGLMGIAFVAPVALYAWVACSTSGPMPLIAPLALLTNGVWWLVLPATQAVVWATIFHGVQYLAIVTVFHAKEQTARPGNRMGPLWHVLAFYAMSLSLGYGLFSCLPWAYVAAGFGMVESVTLVVAAINIHHFIVDAYIWRLKPGDGNRRVVEAGQAAPA